MPDMGYTFYSQAHQKNFASSSDQNPQHIIKQSEEALNNIRQQLAMTAEQINSLTNINSQWHQEYLDELNTLIDTELQEAAWWSYLTQLDTVITSPDQPYEFSYQTLEDASGSLPLEATLRTKHEPESMPSKQYVQKVVQERQALINEKAQTAKRTIESQLPKDSRFMQVARFFVCLLRPIANSIIATKKDKINALLGMRHAVKNRHLTSPELNKSAGAAYNEHIYSNGYYDFEQTEINFASPRSNQAFAATNESRVERQLDKYRSEICLPLDNLRETQRELESKKQDLESRIKNCKDQATVKGPDTFEMQELPAAPLTMKA